MKRLVALCSFTLAFSMIVSATVQGRRPLLVILVEYQDRSFADRNYLANYKARIFGPAEPNVNAYFTEVSRGLFTYVAATDGESYGASDGMVRVLMNVRQQDAGSGREWRNRVLGLADPYFDYRRFDTNRNGRIDQNELTVLAIHATGADGITGKTMTAGDVRLDGTNLDGMPVPVMSEAAPNYVLYHELGHAVDLGGPAGIDMYN